MADTTNQPMAAVVTSEGGIGGLMRTFTPLNPDIEDNTLSSLLELSRTCEALQQKNRSSPQASALLALETNRNSPKPNQNGAYINNIDRSGERTLKPLKPLLPSSLPITPANNQILQAVNTADMSIPPGYMSRKPELSMSYVSSDRTVCHTNSHPMYDEDDEEDDEDDEDDMYYDDSEGDEEVTTPAIVVTPSDNTSEQKSAHSRRKPKSPQHYPSMNSLTEYRQSEDTNTRASDICQQDMWSNNIDEDEDEREMLSDGESFDGKIVYNPDGSAYIIEGESDASDLDSLLDVPQLEGSIVDHRGKPSTSQVPSFPQIANAFYIHKNPSAFYNSYYMYPPEKRSKVDAPIMHSFKVYDLRSQKENLSDNSKGKDNESATTKALLNSSLFSEEVTTVPTKPILMCFICKLSFGYTKSFMAHAIGEHSMVLSEQEREIMSRRNASAIIQGLGKDKEPLMSFLEPTSSPKTGVTSEAQCSSSPLFLPPPLFKNTDNSHVNNSTSSTNVSYVYSNAKVTPIEHVSKAVKCSPFDTSLPKSEQSSSNSISPHSVSPSAGGMHQRLSVNSCPTGASPAANTSQPDHGASSPLPAVTRTPPALLPISVSAQRESSSSHANTSSPRSTCDSSSHCSTPKRIPNGEDSELLYRPYDIRESPKLHDADFTRGGDSRMFLSPHRLSSVSEGHQASSPEGGLSKGAVISSQESPNGKPSSAISQSSMVSSASMGPGPLMDAHGIVIRSGCEDHPQGNISGIECPKCDQILGSSRSLGGHMTMMHSRNSCKTLKCPKCNWHYKYQETLEIHMKEKHPENDTQCIYCLTNQPHPRLARGEVYTCGYKPYRCEVCNYSTTTKGNLSIHMQSDKHINNMQEIQTGTVAVSNPEIKMPPAQPPPPPPPPPPLTPDNMMKKNKPKPTWRCDVCNYETNVARNLRIHMTSEKHTHNMLVLQQNVKHMQRDMQFQMSQLALMGQDPLAIMAGLPPGLAPGMPPFPFDQMFMGPMPGGPGMPGMIEAPMDLTKQENGMLPNVSKASQSTFPMDLKNNNNETSRIFQCSVCNIFSTDSLESLHQHMQLDRSKVILENDDSTTMVGGTYMCNLCQYKTNLKANFQLHCKTDKHLQRLQLVNHIREGGAANEWRLKYMSAGNPVQVRCNACDYYTNSVHKLQLHRTNPRHETNAQLFHHLLTRETCLPPDVMRYFTCTLCSYKTRTKINLIQHIHTMSHMRNESLRVMQLKEQGKEHEYVIENIFQVKEYTDSDLVKFDESDGEAPDGTAHDAEYPEYPGDQLQYKENDHGKGGCSAKISCPFCTFVTNTEMQIQLHMQTQHMGPHAQSISQGGATEQQLTLRCPLCQEKCRDQTILEKHLFQVHSVSTEGMNRLLSMVFVGDPTQHQSPNKNCSITPQKTKENSTITSQQTGQMDDFTRSNDEEKDSQNSSANNTPMVNPAEEITDPMELQAEMMESQALKLAEEATMDGVVLSDKDTDDHYRCQTCAKTFPNIDALYAHQNELGHLELKQTPRGPGYLCWKKGCNQYFKTADALQMHFREIHARTPIVSISERHAYKFRCTQCSLAFKTLDKLQMHSYYHIIRAATKCVVCGRGFRSVAAMRKHVETTHIETMTPTELEKYRMNLASIAPLGLLGMPMADPRMFGAVTTGQMPPLIQLGAPLPLPTHLPESSTKDSSALNKTTSSTEAVSHESQDANKSVSTHDEQTIKQEITDSKAEECNSESVEPMDDETSSQPETEAKDYKDQHFLEDYVNSQAIAENSYSDPSRKFKCHRCKVAFTRQNYLSAHNKTLMHRKGDKANCTIEKYMDPNRPYKCEVCRESFTQKNILLVHYNSVSHLHKVKQHQLQHGGSVEDTLPSESGSTTSSPSDGPQLDIPVSTPTHTVISTQPTVPKHDESKPYKCNICKVAYSQSATMDIHMRSVLHQTRASKLQELAMTGQVDLNQPLTEQPTTITQKMHILQEQQRKALQDAAPGLQSRAEESSEASPPSALMSPPTLLPMVSLPTSTPSVVSPNISSPSPKSLAALSSSSSTPLASVSPSSANSQVKSEPLSPQKADQSNTFSCQKCNAVFANQEHMNQHQQALCYSQQGLMRGMPRFKPHVQKNLLENIGFECVMQFNEFEQKLKNSGLKEAMEVVPESNPEETEKSNQMDDTFKESEEAKPNNIPEINKSRCTTCKKEFSSIWVLKAHQEEVHQQLLPIEYVEEFSLHFKDQYEKKQQQSVPTSSSETTVATPHTEPTTSIETSSIDNPVTQSNMMLDDKSLMVMPNLASEMAMAQAMQMMHMPMLMNGMLPMPMNMSMNMMPPLMPMMMQMGPGPEMFTGMPHMAMMDPNMMLAQQQHQAAALAAQQQKRARTRINDEQLKILRTYFDINNSPTEEHIMEMADKSGLPPKVIKHWFRNTLFKERQRNKDSPYNFSIPPSTSLNLEEYEKTGKISELEAEKDLEAERERDRERERERKEKREAEEREKAIKAKEEEERAKQKEIEHKLSQSIIHREPIVIKPKTEMEEMRHNSQFYLPGQENRDRQSVTSFSDSMRSSAPSTPISTQALPSLIMPPVMPHPGLAGLTPSGMSFSDFSAALMPMGPITTSRGQSPSPSTPQHSSPSTPRSMPNISPSHHGGGPGKRANRTRFTDYQIKVLQEYFEQNAYPKDDDLEHLSRLLNLSPRVIVVWFQNARQKARKNYENQPPLDMSDEASKFTRTPGLNYQCKKCFTVFQRYYELIKHQRTHCYKDDKKMPFSFSQMMGQSSTSFGESDVESESEMPEPDHSPRATSTPKSTATTPTPSNPNNNIKGIEYKCEKCDLVLPRLELWREHQNIHNMNPSLFAPFSNSAFAMLQNVAQQQQPMPQLTPVPQLPPVSTTNPLPSPSANTTIHQTPQLDHVDMSIQVKRKFEEEDFYDMMDQPSRDKRMRTTILPEQLDYLYQKYQVDCNPSRKQLENIATEVGLKKRVVQVWFQNTRARERKGQFRAHQQIIHKRCPICRALFRAKSALESHLATKHPEEMAKGTINVDALPDEDPDTLDQLSSSSPGLMSSGSGLDMAKLLNNPYNMPGPMMGMMSPTSSYGGQDQVQSNMKKLYEDSLKHYLDELSHASHQPRSSKAHSPDSHSDLDRHAVKKRVGEDVPLDLSKPHGAETGSAEDDLHYAPGSNLLDDSKSETYSELSTCGDELFISYYADDSDPSSPNNSTSSNLLRKDLTNTPSFQQKRYRTQMSSTQIRVMKQLFTSYKTPTMAECQLVGREIGLPKRVIQVWFQNARAKEKKAKLNYMNAFGSSTMPELDLQRPPEDCKLCNFKYSHKYTVQDHIFTRSHIDNVREAVMKDLELDHTGVSTMNNTQDARDGGKERKERHSDWPATETASMSSHPHLAQLHAMGLEALSTQGTSNSKPPPSKVKQEPNEADTNESKKSLAAHSSPAQQMLNPFGGMPGLPIAPGSDLNSAAAAGLLPFLYPGLGNMYPGMPMMPGMIPGPESMMMYDPTTFGTPLTLLQIPQLAIQEVQAKVQDPSCTLTRYTQDCRTLTSLKKELSPSDASLAQAAYLDVGYICKKCHMVYPGREACIGHQMTSCFQGKNLTDMIFKLEQQQYKCAACDEKYSMISEYRSHVKTEGHIKAARRCLDNHTPSAKDSRPSSRASAITPPCSMSSIRTSSSSSRLGVTSQTSRPNVTPSASASASQRPSIAASSHGDTATSTAMSPRLSVPAMSVRSSVAAATPHPNTAVSHSSRPTAVSPMSGVHPPPTAPITPQSSITSPVSAPPMLRPNSTTAMSAPPLLKPNVNMSGLPLSMPNITILPSSQSTATSTVLSPPTLVSTESFINN